LTVAVIQINVSYREIPVSAPDPLLSFNPDFRMAAYPWKADISSIEPIGTSGQQ